MKVRASFANLAWFARVHGTVIRHPFGILNQKKFKEGQRQYCALGGGAMLTEAGKRLFEEQVDASNFELDPHSGFFDARFQVDESHLNLVFEYFESGPNAIYEQDPTLDIRAELTGAEPGHESIFTVAELKMIRVVPFGDVRQKPAEVGTDTSARASSLMPTRRLFRIFELVMPNELFEKIQRSPNVRFLSDAELATTDGGSKAGRTSDGFMIQNNLFLR